LRAASREQRGWRREGAVDASIGRLSDLKLVHLVGVLVGVTLAGVVGAFAGPLAASGVVVALVMTFLSTRLSSTRPGAWLALYMATMLLSPDPHFLLFGVQVALHAGDFVFLGGILGMVGHRSWPRSLVVSALVIFLVSAAVSISSAFAFSGTTVGVGALFRLFRLLESVFPLFFAFYRVRSRDVAFDLCRRVLLISGVASCLYGIAQFYLGFDLKSLGIEYAPHRLWVDGQERERAIGFFNESSGFGATAGLVVWIAVFSVLRSTAEMARWERVLTYAAVPIGLLALILSYARSPFVTLAIAVAYGLFAWRSEVFLRRRVQLMGLTAGFALGIALAPSWASLYLSWRVVAPVGALVTAVAERLSSPATELPTEVPGAPVPVTTTPEPGAPVPVTTTPEPAATPLAEPEPSRVATAVEVDSALFALSSGRTSSWPLLLERFRALEPRYLVFGIGYKTLPFSPLAARPGLPALVGDNQFLTTLIEQGAAGLAVLLVLIVAIARLLWKLVRHARDEMTRAHAELVGIYCAALLPMWIVWDYLNLFRLVPILAGLIGILLVSRSDVRTGRDATAAWWRSRDPRSVQVQAAELN
jgi:hypothetical protein